MEGLKHIFEVYERFCEHQTENSNCEKCPANDICNMGLYEKALKELHLKVCINMCENCNHFMVNNSEKFMDCLNEEIDQENYEKHLGQNEKDCPYFQLKSRN